MAASSRSTFLIFCLSQVFILYCLVSILFQVMAIHRIDSHTSNLLLPNNANAMVPPPQKNNKPVIAYVVTITGCGDQKRYSREQAMGLITQGAAVLRHSIHLAHSQSNRYDYQMYALIHPSAKECSSAVSQLGYTTLIRNTPFDRKEIKKEFLREHIDRASCCGEKEYIKLYAYTLVQHPVAVVLDLDSLVLRPLDDLFDAMVLDDGGDVGSSSSSSAIPVHGDNEEKVNVHKKRIVGRMVQCPLRLLLHRLLLHRLLLQIIRRSEIFVADLFCVGCWYCCSNSERRRIFPAETSELLLYNEETPCQFSWRFSG